MDFLTMAYDWWMNKLKKGRWDWSMCWMSREHDEDVGVSFLCLVLRAVQTGRVMLKSSRSLIPKRVSAVWGMVCVFVRVFVCERDFTGGRVGKFHT